VLEIKRVTMLRYFGRPSALQAFDDFFGVLRIDPLNLEGERYALQSHRQPERLPYNSMFPTHNT
jgi:hypothetical protein